MRKYKNNTDNKIEKQERKKKSLLCWICPPNRGENAKRRPKHGRTKPKAKNKR